MTTTRVEYGQSYFLSPLQFASGIDSNELKTMRDSVSSWTANTAKVEDDDEHVSGGSSRATASTGSQHLIGPQLPGESQTSSTTSRGMIGPSIGPRMGPFQVLENVCTQV